MNSKEKSELIRHIEKLYEEQEHDEIIEELMLVEETPDDFDLSYLLIRAFVDISVVSDENTLDAAEMMLSKFHDEKKDNPYWNYQAARVSYFRRQYADALRHVRAAVDSTEDFAERADAEELYQLCIKDYKEYRYTDAQRKDIIKHIEKHFGKIDRIIPDNDAMGISTDIAVVKPTHGRNFYKLVTIGVGAYEMNLPEEFENFDASRAELVLYLPPEWNPDSNEEKDKWVIGLIRSIAEIPVERSTWIGYGHVFSLNRPLLKNTELSGVSLIGVQDCTHEAQRCILSSSGSVLFYQLFLVYQEEIDYRRVHGINAMIDKMPHVSAVLDLNRENVMKGYSPEKDNALAGEEIDYSEDIRFVGEKCAVSDRIYYDGCRVGFMKRIPAELLGDGDPNDSGWLFLAGDESREYLMSPYHISVQSLNTVCNIDEDILPYLESRRGTEMMRDKSGGFTIVSEEDSFDDDLTS